MREIIFILGGPGSGKGTQCKLLNEKYGYKHISVGDLLRNERMKNTEDSNIINKLISNGQIVPSSITIKLILNKIKECNNKIILIDGFPRNLENLNMWNNFNKDIKYKCIYFQCDEDILIKRLLKRGHSDNRDDDNINIIKKRLKVFNESTKQVIEHFDQKSLLHIINTNRDINIIFNELSILI